MKFPIVVLISGNGSNLQSLIDASQSYLKIHIRAVISNRADAYGLVRAQNAGIPIHVIEHKLYPQRQEFDRHLQTYLDKYQPSLIVLAGFMHILGNDLVKKYADRMINIHPSLLPKFPGLNTHDQAIAAHESFHGASIHFVTDQLDSGPLIAQARIAIDPADTPATLKSKVQQLEHRLYPYVVGLFAENRLKLSHHRVYLDEQMLPPHGIQLDSSIINCQY